MVLILWPPPEWPPAPGETFPLLSVGAVRWARGGPCVACLPYHSTGVREKGDRWPGERHHTFCSGLLHAVPPDPNLARGGARWRESRGRGTRDLLGNSDHPWSEVYGVCAGVDRSGISPIKILSLTLGVVVKVRSLHSTPKGKLLAWMTWASVVGGRGWGEMVQECGEREGGNLPCNVPEWIQKNFLKLNCEKDLYQTPVSVRKIL